MNRHVSYLKTVSISSNRHASGACLLDRGRYPGEMANQRDIARELGITQATVSMALREDPSISPAMRERVRATAERLGYQTNAYVNVLMSHVRAGRKMTDKGVIALLIEAAAENEWHAVDSYRVFHGGVRRRSEELGFRVDSFFLREPGMKAERIDEILHTRGITGLILAPPYRGNRTLDIRWDRYAAVGVGFGWESQELDRVVYDNLQNFITAFNALRSRGYRRIGTVLGETFTYGNRYGTKWYTGFLECQDNIPVGERIPVFAGDNKPRQNQVPVFAGGSESIATADFQEWFERWKPDAILTLTGKEIHWLESLGIRVPEDVGLACLSQPASDQFARIDEKGDIVGATAVELVVAQIARNESGAPRHPKTTMIEGRWIEGSTLRNLS